MDKYRDHYYYKSVTGVWHPVFAPWESRKKGRREEGRWSSEVCIPCRNILFLSYTTTSQESRAQSREEHHQQQDLQQVYRTAGTMALLYLNLFRQQQKQQASQSFKGNERETFSFIIFHFISLSTHLISFSERRHLFFLLAPFIISEQENSSPSHL